jgi:hypothetical protein
LDPIYGLDSRVANERNRDIAPVSEIEGDMNSKHYFDEIAQQWDAM